MKRFFLLTTTLLCLCVTQVRAYDFVVGGIYYDKLTTNTVAVTYKEENIQSYSGSITIPSTVAYNGVTYSVTSIGNTAFSRCSGLTSVVAEMETPFAFGSNAFSAIGSSCTLTVPVGTRDPHVAAGLSECALKGGIIEESNSDIIFVDSQVEAVCVDNWDQNGDNKLSYSEAAAVTDLGTVFRGNTLIHSFNELQYFSGLQSIANSAFWGCSSLESITIPNRVRNIYSNAFRDCGSLLDISIPYGVQSITDNTFNGCSSLSSVTLPNGLKTIGINAFLGCRSLSSIAFPPTVKTVEEAAFESCIGLTSVSFPESVTSIGFRAFLNCSGLNSIIISDEATVQYDSFAGCNNLKSINHWTNNGNDTFNFNTWSVENDGSDMAIPFIEIWRGAGNMLNDATITHDPITGLTPGFYTVTIMTRAYNEGNSNTYPSGITFYANNASVKLSDVGMRSVYNSEIVGLSTLIYGELSLDCIVGQDGVLNLGFQIEDAVGDWLAFKNLDYEYKGNNIDFADANVKALCVANWDTNSDGKLSVSEAAAVTDLGEVFKGNATIQTFNELQYFTGLTSIGFEAFRGCRNLVTITIPDQVTSLGGGAFYDCTGLASITIPASVTSIGDYVFSGMNAWANLISIVVENGNPVYDSRNNCNAIIETSSNKLIVGCANTVIPSEVKSIGNGAFEFRTGLTSISLPAGLTSIGDFAFKNCIGLSSIEFPDGLAKIGKEAFLGCIGLTSVTIPGSVTDFEERAFESCTGLTSIDVSSCESNVGAYAFYECNNLKRINNWTTTSTDKFHFNSWSTEQDGSGITTPFIELWRGAGNMLNDATITHDPITGLTPGIYTATILVRFYNEANSTTYPSGVTFFANNASVKLSDVCMRSVYNSEFVGQSALLYGELSLDCTVGQDGVLNLGFQIEDAVGDWLAFKNLNYEYKENNIDFADANVKALCVANWDTNGDGELSEAEAAAVTDLGEVFKGNTTIQTFDELQYFTGLTSIGDHAFYNCSGLTSVTIQSSVTSIGNYAFFGSGLTSVTIPSSVTSIEGSAFASCWRLTSIMVESGNAIYDSRDNCNAIIQTATNTLITGCKNTVIPSSVTNIGWNAFNGCSSLTSVTIPNSVTSIEGYAFVGCKSLTSVVAEMETPFAFGYYAFYDIGSSCTLNVPYGTRDAYIAAGWTENVFKGGIVEAPAPVVLATSVTISEETLYLTTVGETATLTATVLPENVTDGSVTWTSSDESVATVSSDGIVTAVANGTAIITATTNDESNLSATCTVTVNIGDLNNDGTVDVADVMSVINIILELAEETCAADVNSDGSVDIGDIMAIVNIIIKQNSEASPTKRRVRSATTSDDVVVLRKNSGRYAVSLDNEQIYTAFQMTVSVPDGRELKSVEFCDSRLGQFTKVIRPLSDGRYLIMGFSMSGNAISGTVGEIFSLDCESEFDITLQNVVFSTPDAISYTLEVAYETGEATAIRANQTMDIHIVGNTVYVDCDKEQQLSVFNLGGSIVKQVRLSQGENAFTLPDGQYIIRNKKISILSK